MQSAVAELYVVLNFTVKVIIPIHKKTSSGNLEYNGYFGP